MSKLGKVFKGVARGVAAYYTGGASEAIIARAKQAKQVQTSFAQVSPQRFGGDGDIYEAGGEGGAMPTMGSLPGIGAGGVVLYKAGRAAGRIYASAARYCRTNPRWCYGIGGLAAVEGLIRTGQLPVHKRRRGRGITAREFRGFRRVHKVLSGFCAPRMRIRRHGHRVSNV